MQYEMSAPFTFLACVAAGLPVHSALCLFFCLDCSVAAVLAQPSEVLISHQNCDEQNKNPDHTEMIETMND